MLQIPPRNLCPFDGHLMSKRLVLEEMNSVFHGSKCDWRRSTFCSQLLLPVSSSFLNSMQTSTVTEKKKKGTNCYGIVLIFSKYHF